MKTVITLTGCIVLLLTACVDNTPRLKLEDETAALAYLEGTKNDIGATAVKVNQKYRLTDDGSEPVALAIYDLPQDTALEYGELIDTLIAHSKPVARQLHEFLLKPEYFRYVMVIYRFSTPVAYYRDEELYTVDQLTFEYRAPDFLLQPSEHY